MERCEAILWLRGIRKEEEVIGADIARSWEFLWFVLETAGKEKVEKAEEKVKEALGCEKAEKEKKEKEKKEKK